MTFGSGMYIKLKQGNTYMLKCRKLRIMVQRASTQSVTVSVRDSTNEKKGNTYVLQHRDWCEATVMSKLRKHNPLELVLVREFHEKNGEYLPAEASKIA